jgi:hypothetical protein
MRPKYAHYLSYVAYIPDTVRETSNIERVSFFFFLRDAIAQSIQWTLSDRGIVVQFLEGARVFSLFQSVYTAVGSTQLTI